MTRDVFFPGLFNPCTGEFFDIFAHLHVVTDDNKLYITFFGSGTVVLGTKKYTAQSMTHEHTLGEPFLMYNRFIRSGDMTGVIVSDPGDDFFLRQTSLLGPPAIECR